MSIHGRSLRAARASRGWSQARAAEALAALAAQRGLPVPARSSLKTQLSRWENQHVVPDEQYRALLRELYAGTDDELGLTVAPTGDAPDGAEALDSELGAAASVDDRAIELLRAQLTATTALDDRLGAPAVSRAVEAQLSHLERLLAHATVGCVRCGLAELTAGASMLAGRVAVDTCRSATGWLRFEQAKRAAREAEAPVLMACAMAEQAGLMVEVGREAAALELIDEALRVSTPTAPGPALAWLAAGRGGVLAAAGRASEACSAFAVAEERLTAGSAMVDLSFPTMLVRFDDADLRRHRGHALRILRKDESAIVDLQHALRSGSGSVREVAGIHVDLAHAFGATNDQATAQSHARAARELAGRIGSTRLARRVWSGPDGARAESVSRS